MGQLVVDPFWRRIALTNLRELGEDTYCRALNFPRSPHLMIQALRGCHLDPCGDPRNHVVHWHLRPLPIHSRSCSEFVSNYPSNAFDYLIFPFVSLSERETPLCNEVWTPFGEGRKVRWQRVNVVPVGG